MSQPDLVAQLREARAAAPPELRLRVRAIAAQTAPPRRRLTWRRVSLFAVPVAAAIAAAAVLSTGGSHRHAAQPPAPSAARAVAPEAAPKAASGTATAAARADQIVNALGGRRIGGTGNELRYRVPAARREEAVRRLSVLGTVTSPDAGTVVVRLSPS